MPKRTVDIEALIDWAHRRARESRERYYVRGFKSKGGGWYYGAFPYGNQWQRKRGHINDRLG